MGAHPGAASPEIIPDRAGWADGARGDLSWAILAVAGPAGIGTAYVYCLQEAEAAFRAASAPAAPGRRRSAASEVAAPPHPLSPVHIERHSNTGDCGTGKIYHIGCEGSGNSCAAWAGALAAAPRGQAPGTLRPGLGAGLFGSRGQGARAKPRTLKTVSLPRAPGGAALDGLSDRGKGSCRAGGCESAQASACAVRGPAAPAAGSRTTVGMARRRKSGECGQAESTRLGRRSPPRGRGAVAPASRRGAAAAGQGALSKRLLRRSRIREKEPHAH
jgi:hypothetical protein